MRGRKVCFFKGGAVRGLKKTGKGGGGGEKRYPGCPT
eukprot:COSAG05_NODE_19914_length_286_cov_0.508021_1_plen_36_part_10